MAVEEVAVLDIGSLLLKAGVPDEHTLTAPPIVTPSTVLDSNTNAARRVVERGVVQCWEGLETLIDHALYTKSGWQAGQEASVLVAEPIFFSRVARERLTQLLFEHNNAASLLVCDSPVLSLFAMGKLSGCIVDLGHDKTDISAVADGQLIAASAYRLERDPQEVQDSYNSMLNSSEILPDGQKVTIEKTPANKDVTDHVAAVGYHLQEAYMAIQDVGTRKTVMEQLLVCGGGSKIDGISQKLIREFNDTMAPSTAGALIHPADYLPESVAEFSAWVGGGVLVKAVALPQQYMSKMEYNEAGPNAIHKHCI